MKSKYKSMFTIKLKPLNVPNNISNEGDLGSTSPKLADSSFTVDDVEDLPTVNFMSSTGSKRKEIDCDIDFTNCAKRIKLEDLLKELSTAPSENIRTFNVKSALQLEDRDSEDTDIASDSYPERIVHVSPVKIKRQIVDIKDIEKYVETNIYNLFKLPYSKTLFKSSTDASDYLEVYEGRSRGSKRFYASTNHV